MKKTLIFLFSLICLTTLLSFSALGTITQSNNSITEGAINVSTEIGTFSILLNSSIGAGEIYVNISLYKSSTLITSTYLTGKDNGTQSLILPSLDGNTLYQIRVNANDTGGYNNLTYNFTTATKKLTDDTDNFGAGEIALLGIIVLIIIIAFVMSIAKDVKNKKINKDILIKKLVLVIFFTIIIGIIASLI